MADYGEDKEAHELSQALRVHKRESRLSGMLSAWHRHIRSDDVMLMQDSDFERLLESLDRAVRNVLGEVAGIEER
jgi:hypothetical protein